MGYLSNTRDHGHPDWKHHFHIFKKCRDVFLGEDRIKDQNEEYLPALPDQTSASYEIYKSRATFLNAFNRTITGLVGSVMRRPASYEVPDRMQDYLEDVNMMGYDLQTFLAHVLRETFITGRCLILIDRKGDGRPYLTLYGGESFIDWRLDENNQPYYIELKEEVDTSSDPSQDHQMQDQYRNLMLEDGRYMVRVTAHQDEEEENLRIVDETEPTMRGEAIDFIPVSLINPGGPGFSVYHPPLLDLANLCISHYRTSADLEAGRHYVSIPTPYLIGVDPEDYDTGIAIGPTSAIVIPNEAAKVGFLEFAGVGLKSLEEALTQKEHQMSVLGARVLERVRTGVESAEAARIHQASELSILATIVNEVEKSVLASLKMMAMWEGLDPSSVSLTMNRDFVDARLPAKDLQALVDSYLKGALSLDTLVYNMKHGEILSDDTSIQEEVEKIASKGVASSSDE